MFRNEQIFKYFFKFSSIRHTLIRKYTCPVPRDVMHLLKWMVGEEQMFPRGGGRQLLYPPGQSKPKQWKSAYNPSFPLLSLHRTPWRGAFPLFPLVLLDQLGLTLEAADHLRQMAWSNRFSASTSTRQDVGPAKETLACCPDILYPLAMTG